MKLIKVLITISIVNALFVVMAANYLGSTPSTTSVIEKPSSQTSVKEDLAIDPVPSTKPITSTKPVATPAPTTASTPTPIATPTPTPLATIKVSPTGCLVQIDGVKYEITSLTRSHSGGNVFTCGSDMSAIFWDRHNNRILQMMSQYKI